MPSIDLRSVTVAYPVVVSARQQSAFAAVAQTFSFGRLARETTGGKYVVALQGLTLDVPNGTRLGLIGRNGSGKSTLLKTMAGIIHPTRGSVDIEGRIGCLLGLGAGLDPEKTGLDNLRLVARLHGLKGARLESAIEEAAEFTELGPFLNMPTRTYSSGMTARLAFAIATAHQSDLLLIDEVIGTGDAHFVHKAINRVKTLCAESGIVVLASHSSDIMREFCDEAAWLDSGRLMMRGGVDEVFSEYARATI